MAPWPVCRQRGKSIWARRCRKSISANVSKCVSFDTPVLVFQDSMRHANAPRLTWLAEPAHLPFLLMRDLVGCFSLSPVPSCQLEMQCGFHCHRQQQQLWLLPRLGPETQLSCCDCSCCTFGRDRVTVLHSKWHTLPSSSRFPGWSLGCSGMLLGKLSLSLCSLSPSQFLTHLSLCFTYLLILNFLIWKVFLFLFWGGWGKYVMIYQIINLAPFKCLILVDCLQILGVSHLADNPFLGLFWSSQSHIVSVTCKT